jgi:phosphate transport system substrate-binding protein
MAASRFRKALSLVIAAATAFAVAAPSTAMAFTGSMKISGSTTCLPAVQAVATSFMKKYPSAKITVVGGGSGVGISDVLAGRVSIGMSSRDLKTTELQKGAYPTAFARDALTIIVNPANPVKNLTRAQITAIYTGKITNWKQLGGPNAAIVPVGRAVTSGTFEFFKLKFLSGVTQSTRVKSYESNGLVRQAVAGNKYAIGYVSMAYVNSTIKPVSVDGVYPSRANALSGAYKYVRKLYLVTKGRPAGNAKAFVDYCLSSTGQSIVARYYLPAR